MNNPGFSDGSGHPASEPTPYGSSQVSPITKQDGENPPSGLPPPYDFNPNGPTQYPNAQYNIPPAAEGVNASPYPYGQPPYGQPPINPAQPTYYVQGDPRHQTNVIYVQTPVMVAPLANPPPDYLVHSLLTTLFCCWIIGFVALWKSFQVRGAAQAGNAQGAQQASLEARRWNIVSLVTGTIAWVLLVIILICISV